MQGAYSSNLGQLFLYISRMSKYTSKMGIATKINSFSLCSKNLFSHIQVVSQGPAGLNTPPSGREWLPHYREVSPCLSPCQGNGTNLFQKEIALPNPAECIQLRKRCLRIVKYGLYRIKPKHIEECQWVADTIYHPLSLGGMFKSTSLN